MSESDDWSFSSLITESKPAHPRPVSEWLEQVMPPTGSPNLGSPKSSSLPNADIVAYQFDSLSESSSLSNSDSLAPAPIDLMASLPEADGYIKFYHQLTDHLYAQLTLAEQAVHLQLFRLSWGFGKSTCLVSLPTLARRINASRGTVQTAINGLVKKGLVRKEKVILGKNAEQGNIYYVSPPPSLLKSSSPKSSSPNIGSPTFTPNKENTYKEPHTNTESVRVSSRFTLAECRRYADSLRADGITNPGGYATKIHRSGEADDAIAKFLEPIEITKVVDMSGCPDCHGTGFFEPGGAGKGVARCKHERLKA